jgi:hypothetical protein
MNAQDYFGCTSFFYTADHQPATHTFPQSGDKDGGSITVVHLAAPLPPRVLRDGSFLCRFGDEGTSSPGATPNPNRNPSPNPNPNPNPSPNPSPSPSPSPNTNPNPNLNLNPNPKPNPPQP